MKKDNHYFAWGLTAVCVVCAVLLTLAYSSGSSTENRAYSSASTTIHVRATEMALRHLEGARPRRRRMIRSNQLTMLSKNLLQFSN